jgi:hypothetical protein
LPDEPLSYIRTHLRLVNGKADEKRCPFALLTVEPELSPMKLNEALADAESKTASTMPPAQ